MTRNRMTIIQRNIRILGICLLPLFAYSCSDIDTEEGIGRKGQPNLTFNMTRASQDIINNTEVYQFETSWNFKQKVLGVSPGTDKLSMEMAAGTWNLALVTADSDISSRIIPPVNGQTRTGKLWETQSQGGALPSMPELRTSYIDNVGITANQPNTAGPAVLFRNVALVKVVIDKTRGLDESGTHNFELKDVPTTLNWAGGLYPNKENPTLSADPMKGAFTIRPKQGEPGVQDSDTLNFIIPAHKGNDYLGAHNDTTTHNLKLSVDLACLGNTRFQKADVEIPRVPRVNGILLVKLSMIGQLEVDAEILDWVDVSLNADLSQTQLMVDKAEVGLAYKDTVHVNTNASSFTVDKAPGADWITSLNKIGNNAVEIIANVDTYVDNEPRSSYITITANNVTKKIPVTQRPDRGTINISAKELFMSPPHPIKSLNVTSIGGDWKIIGTTAKANPSIIQGNRGTSPVSFTRSSTTNEELFSRYYGDTIVVFKNKITLDTDTVRLSNLFIGIEDGLIEVDQPMVQPDTTSYIDNVKVFGGNTKNLVILNKPDWIHPAPETFYNPSTGIFTFVCDREPNEEERYGEITLMHADDHDYTIKVRVLQDILVRIPEFHFFVVKFYWPRNDVDIKVGFYENTSSEIIDGVTYYTPNVSQLNDMWVGWSWHDFGNPVQYGGQTLLQWGKDARAGQGETAFFNAPLLNTAPYPGQFGVSPTEPEMLPRKLKIRINAAWYYSPTPILTDSIGCFIYCYLNGRMEHNGVTNYDHKHDGDGRTVFIEHRTIKFTKIISNSGLSNSSYDHVADIIYDRKKHTADVQWKMQPYNFTRSMNDVKNVSNKNVLNEDVLSEKDLKAKK